MTKLVLVAFACLLLANCSTVLVNAPHGKTVTLLSSEPTPVKVTVKNWYALWGLIPLNKNNTSDMIGKLDLSAVRVKTYYSPADFIINIPLMLISLQTNTILIEGRP